MSPGCDKVIDKLLAIIIHVYMRTFLIGLPWIQAKTHSNCLCEQVAVFES